jgi:hypothetical protein
MKKVSAHLRGAAYFDPLRDYVHAMAAKQHGLLIWLS